jgi:hypothetical protein
MGDSYVTESSSARTNKHYECKDQLDAFPLNQPNRQWKGMPAKNLMGMPWRLAFALQDFGWVLRSDIIWNKPNPMTEPVRDRPTKSHEYVFLLTKSPKYFYDAEAVKEKAVTAGKPTKKPDGWATHEGGHGSFHKDGREKGEANGVQGEFRNLRSVWKISTHSFRGAHFATFPPKLASRCILAGTSAKGCCPECGSPWVRVVERKRVPTRTGKNTKVAGLDSDVVGNRDPLRHVSVTQSIGWEPSCKCGRDDVRPSVVLDPFSGAGSAGVAAVAAGRRYVGIEINPEYAAMADRRIGRPHAPAIGATGSNRPLPLFD